jgi:hypothetical protein
MPGLVQAQSFADGPPRWYARRGSELLAGGSKVEVLSRIWEQDEAALGAFMSKPGLAGNRRYRNASPKWTSVERAERDKSSQS